MRLSQLIKSLTSNIRDREQKPQSKTFKLSHSESEQNMQPAASQSIENSNISY